MHVTQVMAVSIIIVPTILYLTCEQFTLIILQMLRSGMMQLMIWP